MAKLFNRLVSEVVEIFLPLGLTGLGRRSKVGGISWELESKKDKQALATTSSKGGTLKDLIKIIGLVIATFIVVCIIGFLGEGANFFTFKFWAPKQENVRREVFTNTQSYVQGKVEYLTRLRYQYRMLAVGPQKSALRTLILDEASTIDRDKLPGDLQVFIHGLEENPE